METTNIAARIDLGLLADELSRYENQWVAVSRENKIVASGRTYRDALAAAGAAEVILFKVPPLDAWIAP